MARPGGRRTDGRGEPPQPAPDAGRDRADDGRPPSPLVHPPARRRATAGGAGSLLRETVIILVSAIVLSLLVKTFLVQAFFIPSQSMHDTLDRARPDPGQQAHARPVRPAPRRHRRVQGPGRLAPRRQVVPDPGPVRARINYALTFIGLYPADANEHLVKRLIGLPGDHVACRGPGEPVTVNGVPLDEPYLAAGRDPERASRSTSPCRRTASG